MRWRKSEKFHPNCNKLKRSMMKPERWEMLNKKNLRKSKKKSTSSSFKKFKLKALRI
jgi:hypothetical protein